MQYNTEKEVVTTETVGTYIGLVQVAERELGSWHIQAAGRTQNRSYGGALDVSSPHDLIIDGAAIPSLAGTERKYWPAVIMAVNGDPVRLTLLHGLSSPSGYYHFAGNDGDALRALVKDVVA